MNGKPTRRSFFGHAGAALAAPLAATAFAGEHHGASYVWGRITALEDANAIRGLQRRYARLVGAGKPKALAALFTAAASAPGDEHVRRVVIDGDDAIEIRSDGTATARVQCIVTTATPIEGDGTLVEMARLQGDGVVRRSEKRVLASSFVKIDGAWKITRVELLA